VTDLALDVPAPIDLIAATRSGDATALARLYEQHAGLLLRSATLLLRSRADAEDLVHDLFVGLPEALAHYEERGALAAWLGRVATRMALVRLRTRRRRHEVDLDAAVQAPADSRSDRLRCCDSATG
jgi:RNA polymerase sigma-70 factor (ECF subfamily)